MSELSEADVQRIAKAVIQGLSKGPGSIAHDQASSIAAAAARTAVQETVVKGMALMGINITDAKHIDALKEDLAFARNLRIRMDRIGRSMTTSITNAITYGFVVLVVIGFFWWVRGQGLPPKALPK